MRWIRVDREDDALERRALAQVLAYPIHHGRRRVLRRYAADTGPERDQPEARGAQLLGAAQAAAGGETDVPHIRVSAERHGGGVDDPLARRHLPGVRRDRIA